MNCLTDPLFDSYDETLAAWFYYDFTNGDTQWHHPLDEIYKEKVIKAREESAKQKGDEGDVKPVNNSDTEQTLDIPKDIEKTHSKSKSEETTQKNEDDDINSEYKDLKVKNRQLLDVDENTEISVDTTEILEQQSDRNMMQPLAPLGPIGR